MKLSHQMFTSVDAIRLQQECWTRIVDIEYQGDPFLTMEWHLNWLKHFADRNTLVRYVAVHAGGDTLGFFPLIIKKASFHGLPLRVLSYAGNLYTPINCPVVRRTTSSLVMDYFVRQVLPEMEWDVASLSQLCEEYPGLNELSMALGGVGYRLRVQPGAGNWIYEGADIDAETFFLRLKPNLRNDTRRFPRKMAELGELTFRLVSQPLTEKDIDAYRDVYSRSWKEAELDADFHPDLMRLVAPKGWLRLGFLCLDGRPIATQLWLYRNLRGYIVKTAYDEEYNRFSPGTVLTWRIIEHMIRDEGMRYFDYLKGDDTYKKNWTNKRRQRFDMICFRKNMAGYVGFMLDQRLLPWIRNNSGMNRVKRAAVSLLNSINKL